MFCEKLNKSKSPMEKKKLFTLNDFKNIRTLGAAAGDLQKQLAIYRQGASYFKLDRPCIVGDGIISFTYKQRRRLIEFYEKTAGKYKLIKFVPASGAASRMFADWFEAWEKGSFCSAVRDRKFLRDLAKLPFFPLIKKDKKGQKLFAEKKIKGLLEFILTESGLNFGALPKALIPFHCYLSGETRTALEEHLDEAAQYLRNRKNNCHLHFTTSTEYQKDVVKYLKAASGKYEKLCGVKFKISYSIQFPATDTIAVAENNLPLRDNAGRLILRPGGHGALLANLNSLDADFIFVKNIDNIAPRPLREKNLPYKKLLGGIAFNIREDILTIISKIKQEELSTAAIKNIIKYCSETINIDFPPGMAKLPKKKKISAIFSALNRPLRVCGMVKNVGEPGGGPFWVVEKNSTQTLQIVERGHIDKSRPEQLAIWSRAKYFNPVDMVCCIKDYRGEKFNLDNFVNRNAYLITEKSEKGRKLKALELPGLWNGGMAYWNTVFVELPLLVFNPVKTVYDLLRPEHLKSS
jgi:hypothetical protein